MEILVVGTLILVMIPWLAHQRSKNKLPINVSGNCRTYIKYNGYSVRELKQLPANRKNCLPLSGCSVDFSNAASDLYVKENFILHSISVKKEDKLWNFAFRMLGKGTYICVLPLKTLEKAKKELNEDPNERASQIQTLRDWVKAQPHIRSRTDFYVLLSLVSFENYWTVRSVPGKGAPDWFHNIAPNNPRIQEVLDLGVAVPLPGKDDEGRQVVLIRTGAYKPKEYSAADILRVCFVNNDAMLLDEENQVHGFQTILDFSDFSAGHVWYYTKDTIQKAIRCWQDTYPMRQRGSHYVNTPAVFNAVFEMFLYLVKEKSRKRMIVHKNDLESLHSKVPKRLLPTHLGGDAWNIEDIAKSWKEHVLKCQAEFDLNKQYGIDEDKIPTREKQSNGWGITGVFTKLNADCLMYRKSMEEDQANEGGGSVFVARLSELPVSQMALVQLSSLYNLAREQRLLAMGLKAGEGTLHFAVKVASPIVSMLPVSSIDHMACRQLEKLEEVVPALKKDPKQLGTSPGEIVNNALAPAVSAVKEISTNTVTGVKNFATETTAPTVERVNKVTAYSKQTFDNMKSGVASTYEGAKETVVKLCSRDGVKSAVSTSYDTVRNLNYDDIKASVGTRREVLITGVKTRVEGVKHEVGEYAAETLRPTVARATQVKKYTVDKVADTYTGAKDMGNRVVESVYNNRLVNAVNGTLTGVLGYAEHALDTYLPLDDDMEQKTDEDRTSAMEIHPASPEAGTWTRTMVLMSNFRERIYTKGTRNYKYYSTQATDMTDYAMKRYNSTMESVQSAYSSSYDYVAASYASVKNRLANSSETVTNAYNATKQRLTNASEFTTNATKRSYDFMSSAYSNTKTGVAKTGEYVVVSYRSAVKGTRVSLDYVTDVYSKTRQMGHDVRVVIIDTWSVGHSRVAGMYGYVSELAQHVVDEAKATCVYKNVFGDGSVKKLKKPVEEIAMEPKKTPSIEVTPTDESEPRQSDLRPLAESSPKDINKSPISDSKIQTPARTSTPSARVRSSGVKRSSAKTKTEEPKERKETPPPKMDVDE